MYSAILAAVNEHLNSEISARYALHLAKACAARCSLCFIAERGASQADVGRAEDAIKRLFITAREMDLQVESIIECGDPVKEIEKIVRREGINIVLASSRREDIERRFYAGTVARRLSLSLPCSVAIVRVAHPGRIHPREILIPLKAKINHVEERAYFIAKIAQAFGSKVFLFHAPEPITNFFHGELHLTPLQWEEQLPRDITHFMGHMRRYKVVHTGRAVPGRVGKTIAVEAFSKRHDLIIMGASERSLLSSLLKGNPVEEVLRNTPCDLIILRPRHEDT